MSKYLNSLTPEQQAPYWEHINKLAPKEQEEYFKYLDSTEWYIPKIQRSKLYEAVKKADLLEQEQKKKEEEEFQLTVKGYESQGLGSDEWHNQIEQQKSEIRQLFQAQKEQRAKEHISVDIKEEEKEKSDIQEEENGIKAMVEMEVEILHALKLQVEMNNIQKQQLYFSADNMLDDIKQKSAFIDENINKINKGSKYTVKFFDERQKQLQQILQSYDNLRSFDLAKEFAQDYTNLLYDNAYQPLIIKNKTDEILKETQFDTHEMRFASDNLANGYDDDDDVSIYSEVSDLSDVEIEPSVVIAYNQPPTNEGISIMEGHVKTLDIKPATKFNIPVDVIKSESSSSGSFAFSEEFKNIANYLELENTKISNDVEKASEYHQQEQPVEQNQHCSIESSSIVKSTEFDNTLSNSENSKNSYIIQESANMFQYNNQEGNNSKQSIISQSTADNNNSFISNSETDRIQTASVDKKDKFEQTVLRVTSKIFLPRNKSGSIFDKQSKGICNSAELTMHSNRNSIDSFESFPRIPLKSVDKKKKEKEANNEKGKTSKRVKQAFKRAFSKKK